MSVPRCRDEIRALAARKRSAECAPEKIRSAKHLAQVMAEKAALIKESVMRVLMRDLAAKEHSAASRLLDAYHALQREALADIQPEEFADVCAECITYGLFAARIQVQSVGRFSCTEARDFLPKSQPFLRDLFGCITDQNLDERLRRLVDDLCEILRVADVQKVLKNFGERSASQDPFLHFYEEFLREYNPKKRKTRGVWYTPEPVTQFIVRAVDSVLQREFSLADGLADVSRVCVGGDAGQRDAKGRAKALKKQVHRVQILDPATGTGTFLVEALKLVAGRVQASAPGHWSRYVEQELIPRLWGFELLLASYAMCHLKLDMSLTHLGYQLSSAPPRFAVHLDNTLEAAERMEEHLLSLSRASIEEAKGASGIKQQLPILCILGNPPYSGHSGNKSPWIMKLMEDYKREPFGKEKLKERNIKWLNDDYVKFIRFAEHLIEKNGEGIIGYVTNHSYLDNPTFRGMRWHLRKTFDTIWVVDLHGNVKKREVCPDGRADHNVFDIMQGTAILIAVKKTRKSGKKKPLAEVRLGELWGSREEKFAALEASSLAQMACHTLKNQSANSPWILRADTLDGQYEKGFKISQLMPTKSVGIVTARDGFTIAENAADLWQRVQKFVMLDAEQARARYSLGEDARDWRVLWAQQDNKAHLTPDYLQPIAYRPFDTRWTFYTGKSRGFHCYPRHEVMRHLLRPENLALQISRQRKSPGSYCNVMVHAGIAESSFVSNKTSEIGSSFPLYLYAAEGALDSVVRVNFEPALYARIATIAGLEPELRTLRSVSELQRAVGEGRPDELQLFDYLYGALHSTAYRQKYAALLKQDFPRIPYPTSAEMFRRVSAQGETLRRLHLMDESVLGEASYVFCGEGNRVVEKPRYFDGKIWLNHAQCFDNVPKVAWDFAIGGHQPAQKWLKDRRGRALDDAELKHYQNVLKALWQSAQIMQTICLKE